MAGLWWLGVVGAIVAGVLLRVRVLSTGFILDDYVQLEMSRTLGGEPLWTAAPSYKLYAFVAQGTAPELMARGSLPWWTDPELLAAPMRPLPSLLLALEYRVFGAEPFGPHCVSVALWSAMMLVVAGFYRRLLAPGAALFATWIYALSLAHSMPLIWIANQCAILACGFGVASLWALLAWREGGWRPGAVVYPLLLALSLACAEYGLCVVALVVCYELGSVAARNRTLVQRLSALAPPLGVLTLHQLALRFLGYGVSGSLLYIDPLHDPKLYVVRVLQQLPSMLVDGVLGLFAPPGNPWVVLFSVFALPILVWFWRVARRKAGGERDLGWLVLGSLAALLPLSASGYSTRLMIVAGVGLSGLVASAALGAFQALRRGEAGLWRFPSALVAAGLAFSHVILSPMGSAVETMLGADLNRSLRNAALDAKFGARDVLILGATDTFSFHYPPLVAKLHEQPVPRGWWVLSASYQPQAVKRVDASTIELVSAKGDLLTNPSALVYRRPDRPLDVHSQVRVGPIEATVLEVGDTGPKRVRFHFEGTLDDSRYAVYLATPKGYIPYRLPAIGKSQYIPAANVPSEVKHGPGGLR